MVSGGIRKKDSTKVVNGRRETRSRVREDYLTVNSALAREEQSTEAPVDPRVLGCLAPDNREREASRGRRGVTEVVILPARAAHQQKTCRQNDPRRRESLRVVARVLQAGQSSR